MKKAGSRSHLPRGKSVIGESKRDRCLDGANVGFIRAGGGQAHLQAHRLGIKIANCWFFACDSNLDFVTGLEIDVWLANFTQHDAGIGAGGVEDI